MKEEKVFLQKDEYIREERKIFENIEQYCERKKETEICEMAGKRIKE